MKDKTLYKAIKFCLSKKGKKIIQDHAKPIEQKCKCDKTDKEDIEIWGHANYCPLFEPVKQLNMREEFDKFYYGNINKLSDNDLWKFCRTSEVGDFVRKLVASEVEAKKHEAFNAGFEVYRLQLKRKIKRMKTRHITNTKDFISGEGGWVISAQEEIDHINKKIDDILEMI